MSLKLRPSAFKSLEGLCVLAYNVGVSSNLLCALGLSVGLSLEVVVSDNLEDC